jgi:hypothetical protein
MTAGARGRRNCTESEIGAGVARTVPPSDWATKSEEPETSRQILLRAFGSAADEELKDDRPTELIGDEGGECALLDEYRRMLNGVRKLPRQLRPRARREARDWLRLALKALRQRQSLNRRFSREERRKQIRRRDAPKRRPPG